MLVTREGKSISARVKNQSLRSSLNMVPWCVLVIFSVPGSLAIIAALPCGLLQGKWRWRNGRLGGDRHEKTHGQEMQVVSTNAWGDSAWGG